MFKAILFLTAMISSSAFACQTTSAKIEGTLEGAGPDRGACYVSVKITKAEPHPVCKLNLRVGQIINVRTSIPVKSCPEDEARVKETVTRLGDGFVLNGTVR